jgi:hypothetical protein
VDASASQSKVSSVEVEAAVVEDQGSTQTSSRSQGASGKKEKDKESLNLLPWIIHTGPWASVDEANASLNNQWRSSTSGTGVLHKGSSMTRMNLSSTVPIKRKMFYCYMKCKNECKFNIIIEEDAVQGTWSIASIGPECQHKNPTTVAEINAFAALRGIRENLVQEGITLRRNGAKVAFIFRHLANKHREEFGTEPTFTYHDVFTAVTPLKSQISMDSTGLQCSALPTLFTLLTLFAHFTLFTLFTLFAHFTLFTLFTLLTL